MWRTSDYTPVAAHAMARYFEDGGMRMARGSVFLPTIQTRVLGGGSVFNSAICLPPQGFALRRWEERNGLVGMDEASLRPYIDRAWSFMGVQPTPAAVQGPRNDLFALAADRLGWSSEPIARNVQGCDGAGVCIIGCPSGAKNSVDRRGIPELLEAGGTVYTSLRVDKITFKGGKATGAEGWVVNTDTGARLHRARIKAKVVVVSAGAVGTPALLQRSGLRRKAIGANLQFHPGTQLMALFDKPVYPWAGATQGYHSLQFLDQGIKLETLWGSAELMAFRFPAYGARLKNLLGDYDKIAVWDAWVSGIDSVGSVRALPGGKVDIQYTIGDGDVLRMSEAMAKLTEMAFAAGGVGAITGVHGLPDVLRDPADAKLFRQRQFKADHFPMASNHVFGGMCMGADEDLHATGNDQRVYGTENVYVADTGLFPESPGVNPMFPAMVLAERLADILVARYG
ncbi:MAG: GMC family oxidoreductase N-terminal domain-containing protein [Deltaproteobacteria bacterium]|nr:GMC family oxidoreductase N-terminal domain-containing protein [Deltaproteobacteria bacterium]